MSNIPHMSMTERVEGPNIFSVGYIVDWVVRRIIFCCAAIAVSKTQVKDKETEDEEAEDEEAEDQEAEDQEAAQERHPRNSALLVARK